MSSIIIEPGAPDRTVYRQWLDAREVLNEKPPPFQPEPEKEIPPPVREFEDDQGALRPERLPENSLPSDEIRTQLQEAAEESERLYRNRQMEDVTFRTYYRGGIGITFDEII